MVRKLSLLAFLAVAACATPKVPEPIIKTVTVNIPVPQPCVPKTLGDRPAYPDTDQALLNAVDAAERYQLIFAGRILRDARLGEIEPVIASCPKEK